jgi:hypothetical protein
LIVSSSLHGIIFAHSLNIPAIYFNELNEPESIKFLDYFSTIEKKVISIDKLSDLKTIIYPDSAPEVAHLISSINFPKHADLSAKKIIY